MSRCPDCGCALPDSQTLRSGCYDARYAKVGRPTRSKSFRERLTHPNVLLFLGTFALGFLELRFDASYFPFNLFSRYRYHLMPTNTAALTAFVLASCFFYVESSRRASPDEGSNTRRHPVHRYSDQHDWER